METKYTVTKKYTVRFNLPFLFDEVEALNKQEAQKRAINMAIQSIEETPASALYFTGLKVTENP